MSFLAELKRRNVFRAAAAYVAVAWILMQVAEVTFPAFGLSHDALRLLIIVLVIGFVPAVTLAWVFEITPEGVKRERNLDRKGALAQRTNRLLDRAIMVLFGLGLTYFAVDKFLLDPARDERRVEAALEQARDEALGEPRRGKSIVVLPFANLSGDPEQEYFSDGMAEELLNLLAKIPELRVISRSSAFSFKGQNVGVAEIARQLKVSHVLEGSVRTSGERVRITAQLVDARTDAQLWSETFDRTVDDVLAVQDEIAAQVISRLQLELLGAVPKTRRVNPQAYLLQLQAEQLMIDRYPDYARIESLLRRALEIDPGYAEPWNGLALLYYQCWLVVGGNQRLQVPPDPRHEFCTRMGKAEADRRGREALDKALEVDPANATAISYLAHRAFDRGDLLEAARGFERAAALDPTNPRMLGVIMYFARAIRRPELVIRIGEFLISRDPANAGPADDLGRAYEVVGRLDEAESALRAANQSPHILARVLLQKGAAQAALDMVRASFGDSEDDRAWELYVESMALHSLRREAESAAALATLVSDFGDQYSYAHLVAAAYAWKGDHDTAATWLLRYLEADQWQIGDGVQLSVPILQPLLEQPRIRTLLRQRGLASDQLAQIKLDIQLPGES